MRVYIFLAVFLALAGFGLVSAHADTRVTVKTGSGCYRTEEAEAEQAIRIHSELMVIGLNCQNQRRIPGAAGLYNKYRQFSAKHGKLFAEYEARLIGYFLRQGVKNPELALHTLHTVFANKVATDAAHMRPDLFCARYAPRIDRVSGMNDNAIRKWAATFYPSHPVSHPICAH